MKTINNLILGAGISGIAAAFELKNNKLDECSY